MKNYYLIFLILTEFVWHCTESQLPKSWDPMTPLESSKQVTLSPTSTEYQDVEQNMMSSAGQTVHQIINVNTYLRVVYLLVPAAII